MPDEEKEGGWKETLLGLVVILIVLAGVLWGILATYPKVFPSVHEVVSLSSYFVDTAGNPLSPDSPNYAKSHIKVIGDVSQGAQSVKNGSVRLTISSADNGSFRQSIYIPFSNGHFETADPAFWSVHPGDPIEIKAEVTVQGLNETATIYLNHKPPVESPVSTTVFGWGLFVAVLFVGLVFPVVFTGRKSAKKNRVAIIFSYLIIAICLTAPFLALPILIYLFPGAVPAMIGAPVGLVNTHIPNQPEGPEWALNIGGYSFEAGAKPPENPSNTKPGRDATAEKPATTEPSSPTGAGSGTPGAPSGSSSSSNTTPASLPTPNPSDEVASTVPSSSRAATGTPAVQVRGGLVIPLYVIILSVIGGAINMTRKVPGFQREGEESDFPGARQVGNLVKKLLPSPGSAGAAAPPAPSGPVAPAPVADAEKPEESLEEQAQAIDDQLVPLVTAQLQRNGETDATLALIRDLVSEMQVVYKKRQANEPLLKFNSFDDWAASHPRLRELLRGSWRVELLNQYMYLVSAPFLAIVTYYILDLLGLSKKGVVVVLSFSVGLISERIVSWILGIATGYLRTDTGSAPAKAA